MLTLQMGGKAVTTTNNKQVMKINGNEVEIERIGNGIYVNGLPINLIIADKTGLNWKGIFGKSALFIAAAGVGFVGVTYALPSYGPVVVEFITTQSSALIDLVMGYVN